MVCSQCKEKGHTSTTCLSKYPSLTKISSNSECAICISSSNKTKCVTKCKHVFHISCLKRWLSTNNTCPICRTPLVEKTDNITDIIIRTIMGQYLDLSNEELLAVFQSDFLI